MKVYIISYSVKPSNFAVTTIGILAIAAQVLLVRELINIFSGNELVYGLTIFLWMLLYAFGSGVLGRISDRITNKETIFSWLIILSAVLLPAEVYLSRIMKNLLGIPIGVEVDLQVILLITAIIIAPLTITLGFIFSLASRILKGSIGKAYLFEAIGSVIGGAFFTYFLIYFFNAFQIAGILSLLMVAAVILMRPDRPRYLLLIIPLLLIVFSSRIDRFSSQQSWQDYQLATSADSPYGRIAIIKDNGSYNFYENSDLLFSSGDILGAEETVHLSLLLHPNPRSVLLVGGGPGGVLQELSKYRMENIDYVEIDYKIMELAKKLFTVDPKVNIHAVDSLEYIKNTGKRYDVILIDLPSPSTLLLNRFYTLNFFNTAGTKLSQGGILVFKAETSESYLGRELKLLNQCLYKTFARSFKHTVVLPGNYNYFFGSNEPIADNRELLIERWKKRDIPTTYFRADTLYFLLWPDKVNYIRDTIKFDETTPLNTDFTPISYYYGLLIWASHFYSPLKNVFYALMGFRFVHFLLALIIVVLLLKFISLKFKNISIPAVIALLGFCGICAQLVIIYAFQSFYGYVYQAIGLLTTSFMAGLAAGSGLILWKQDQIDDPLAKLKVLIMLLISNLVIIAAAIKTFPLLLAPFIISLPIGAAFPLAVKAQEKFKAGTGKLAGILYGSDLFGGALGAIITTILLIPVFGILNTLGLAIVLAIATLVMAYS